VYKDNDDVDVDVKLLISAVQSRDYCDSTLTIKNATNQLVTKKVFFLFSENWHKGSINVFRCIINCLFLMMTMMMI